MIFAKDAYDEML